MEFKIDYEDFRKDEGLFFDFLDFWLDFRPKEFQKKFLLDCLQKKRVSGIWCRQSGKSTCVSIYCTFRSILQPTSIMIVGPGLSQTTELFSKIKSRIENNIKLNMEIKRLTQTELEWNNGSKIKALPTSTEGKAIRGHTADIIIVEEAGLIDDEIFNSAVTPLIASKGDEGQIIKIGTPLLKNHFFKSCYIDKSYNVSKVTWKECLRDKQYTQSFIDEQKHQLTDIQFRTEYEADFVEENSVFFPSILLNSSMSIYPLIKNI